MKAQELINIVDSVAINAHDTKKEVDILIDDAIKYGYKLIFPLACFNEYAIERLKGTGTKVGGGVGSALGVGEEPTAVKLAAAKHWAEAGCGEIEMFMNVPKLRSGMYDEVRSEMKAVRDLVPVTFKVIIHTPLLTKEEIEKASELVVQSGADYIKTTTGFFGPTTVEDVRTIKETVGDRIQIKAAGGVSGLDMIAELMEIGVTRFGLSNAKLVKYIGELEK